MSDLGARANSPSFLALVLLSASLVCRCATDLARAQRRNHGLNTPKSRADAANAAVEAWDQFTRALKATRGRLNDRAVADTLVTALLTLRLHLAGVARLADVATDYTDFLK